GPGTGGAPRWRLRRAAKSGGPGFTAAVLLPSRRYLKIRQQDDGNVDTVLAVAQPEQQLGRVLRADQDPVGPQPCEELDGLAAGGQVLDPGARLGVGARHCVPDVLPLV